jgi:hypothetical protein
MATIHPTPDEGEKKTDDQPPARIPGAPPGTEWGPKKDDDDADKKKGEPEKDEPKHDDDKKHHTSTVQHVPPKK